MNYYTVKRNALVLAKQAEFEAMLAENRRREARAEFPAYSEEAFMTISNDFQNLAYCHDEQL